MCGFIAVAHDISRTQTQAANTVVVEQKDIVECIDQTTGRQKLRRNIILTNSFSNRRCHIITILKFCNHRIANIAVLDKM